MRWLKENIQNSLKKLIYAYTKKEHADKIMEIALEYAGNYYKKCYLETLDNMTRAQRFYEKYGFYRVDKPVVITEHFACEVKYLKDLKNESI